MWWVIYLTRTSGGTYYTKINPATQCDATQDMGWATGLAGLVRMLENLAIPTFRTL
jgi:hypothetical protein